MPDIAELLTQAGIPTSKDGHVLSLAARVAMLAAQKVHAEAQAQRYENTLARERRENAVAAAAVSVAIGELDRAAVQRATPARDADMLQAARNVLRVWFGFGPHGEPSGDHDHVWPLRELARRGRQLLADASAPVVSSAAGADIGGRAPYNSVTLTRAGGYDPILGRHAPENHDPTREAIPAVTPVPHAPHCHATAPTPDRPRGGCICGAARRSGL